MGTEERQALEGIQKELRLKRVNRQQMILRAVDVEKLIEPEHPARAIWELVDGLDLSAFRALHFLLPASQCHRGPVLLAPASVGF
jgi:hypothetical protein